MCGNVLDLNSGPWQSTAPSHKKSTHPSSPIGAIVALLKVRENNSPCPGLSHNLSHPLVVHEADEGSLLVPVWVRIGL